MRVNLYYREKCGVRFDEGYTEWMLMLSNATREEVLAFMSRFDWSRSDWNTIGVEHKAEGSMKNPNWEKVDQLTSHQQYGLLLCLTDKISLNKMDELIRRQKLLSIDSAMWSEAFWFRQLCKRAVSA